MCALQLITAVAPHVKRMNRRLWTSSVLLYIRMHHHLAGARQTLRRGLLWGAYLRSSKASVGSVTGDVGLAAEAHHAHIGDLVGVVNVHHGSFHDGCAQVQAVAGVVVQLTVQGLHLAVLVECDLKASQA